MAKNKNKIKRSFGSYVFDTFNVILMCLLATICLYPFLHIFFASFSDGTALLSHTGLLLKPIEFTLSGYEMVFRDPMIFKGYINTFFVVIVGTFISLIVTLLGAYFLSRKNVLWQKPVFIIIIFTMFFSGGMIPFYLTVLDVGLDDSLWALIIPSMVNTFNLIIMRTGISSIPDSLEESVKLDGGGHIRFLLSIVIPLSLPIISVILLYYAVEKWNAWFHAMMFIKTRSKQPLQLVLRGILLSNDTAAMTSGGTTGDQMSASEAVKYGVIIVATLPILCVYPFLQKYFVKGTLVGAVKG